MTCYLEQNPTRYSEEQLETHRLIKSLKDSGLGAYLGRSLANNHRLTKILTLLTILVVLTALFHAPSA